MASKVPMLKLIVSVDELSTEAKRIMGIWSRTANVQVMELSERELLLRTFSVMSLIMLYS